MKTAPQMSLTFELSKTFGAVANRSHAFPLSAPRMAVHVGAWLCMCVCVHVCMWVCCECHCASPLSCLSFNCLHLRRIWRLLFASSSTVCRSVCSLCHSPLPPSFVRLRLCMRLAGYDSCEKSLRERSKENYNYKVWYAEVRAMCSPATDSGCLTI